MIRCVACLLVLLVSVSCPALTLAGVYILMAMVHHCLYCLIPMALAGASWTLAASELWVIAQRAIPDSLRGRISALMMVLSQGAMTLGAIVWGVGAQIAGTRVILFAAAFLFLIAVLGSMLFPTIFRKSFTIEGKTPASSGIDSLVRG
jgi:transmembrane secretion effector